MPHLGGAERFRMQAARLLELERHFERGEKEEARFPVGTPGTFNRETDVTWDSQDNIYVSDGYGNSRIAKMRKDGTWVKAVGTHGSGPDQFNTPHGITSDAQGNIYVADQFNHVIGISCADRGEQVCKNRAC